jgi:hypothetical protein
MRFVIYIVVIVALGLFVRDYWEVRTQALCAHSNVIHTKR